MMKKLMLIILLPVLFTACGPKIYKSTEFDAAAASHKTVAILPAQVVMQLRPNQAKNLTAEDIQNMQKSTGYSIQDKMYGWFLRRNDKMRYTVSFQDVIKLTRYLKMPVLNMKTCLQHQIRNWQTCWVLML